MNSIWIKYLFREFTMNSLSVSRIQLNLLLFSCIRFLLREFTLKPLSFPRMHYKYKICFANSPWIHFPFFGITMNSLSARKITLNPLFSGKLLWIHYLLCDFSFKSLSFFAEQLWTAMKSLWIHYCFAIFLWIDYLFREFTICFTIPFHVITVKTLSALRFYNEFTIVFVISLWIH